MEKKIIIASTVYGFAVLINGCAVYPDGKVASAFDQATIKAELMKAEKEYGR
jgi:hypothetical protein